MCSSTSIGQKDIRLLPDNCNLYLCVLKEKIAKEKNINKAEVYTQVRVKRQIRVMIHTEKSEASGDSKRIRIGILVMFHLM